MALLVPQVSPVLSTIIIGGGYHPYGLIVASFYFIDIILYIKIQNALMYGIPKLFLTSVTHICSKYLKVTMGDKFAIITWIS